MKQLVPCTIISIFLIACSPVSKLKKIADSKTKDNVSFGVVEESVGGIPRIGDSLVIEYSGFYNVGKPFFEGKKITRIAKGSIDNPFGINSGIETLKVGEERVVLVKHSQISGKTFQPYLSDDKYIYSIKLLESKQNNRVKGTTGPYLNDTIQLKKGVSFIYLKKGDGKRPLAEDKVKLSYSSVINGSYLVDDNLNKSKTSFVVGRSVFDISGLNGILPKLSAGDYIKVFLTADDSFGKKYKNGQFGDYSVECYLEIHAVQAKPQVKPYNVEGKDTLSLESGIKYIIIEKGESETKPIEKDKVKVHYTGYHLPGIEHFDSSVLNGKPFSFVVGTPNIIQGWNLGIKVMGLNSKVRFIIPSELAYGKNGRLPVIDKNEDLIFDIELLEIN